MNFKHINTRPTINSSWQQPYKFQQMFHNNASFGKFKLIGKAERRFVSIYMGKLWIIGIIAKTSNGDSVLRMVFPWNLSSCQISKVIGCVRLNLPFFLFHFDCSHFFVIYFRQSEVVTVICMRSICEHCNIVFFSVKFCSISFIFFLCQITTGIFYLFNFCDRSLVQNLKDDLFSTASFDIHLFIWPSKSDTCFFTLNFDTNLFMPLNADSILFLCCYINKSIIWVFVVVFSFTYPWSWSLVNTRISTASSLSWFVSYYHNLSLNFFVSIFKQPLLYFFVIFSEKFRYTRCL